MTRPRTGIAVVLNAIGIAVSAACAHPVDAPAPDFTANGGSPVGMPGMTAPASPPPAQPTTSTAAALRPAAGIAVDISNFAFAPATLTVKVGDPVTWTNHDEEPHTVAADDGSFHSPGMGTNATYTFTFTAPGSYGYICTIHPFMHGTVVVTA